MLGAATDPWTSDGRLTGTMCSRSGGRGSRTRAPSRSDAPASVLDRDDLRQAVWLLVHALRFWRSYSALAARSVDVFHAAWLAALAVLIVTLADLGAFFNHTPISRSHGVLAGRVRRPNQGWLLGVLRTVARLTIVGRPIPAQLFTSGRSARFSARDATVGRSRFETASELSGSATQGVCVEGECVIGRGSGSGSRSDDPPVILDPFHARPARK
jgi:hypothetical protein